MCLKKKVKILLDEILQKRKDIFVIDFNMDENNIIKIIIDGDKGVTIDDIVQVSRHIEHNLDRDEEDFSLTVSSVDITQAFSLKRQFIKNLNRKIKVKTDNTKKEGTLIAINDENITLEYKVREPKKIGKGKVTVTKQDIIAFDDIKEAKVILKF